MSAETPNVWLLRSMHCAHARLRAQVVSRSMLLEGARGAVRGAGVLFLMLVLHTVRGDVLGAQAAEAPIAGIEQTQVDPPSAPTEAAALQVWEEAERHGGRRVLVSIAERRLWLMDGSSVIYSAPVAVGKSVILEYDDRTWNFATPRGRRNVIGKERNPVWVPPDWHYVELAIAQRWKLEELRPGRSFPLSDGSKVVVRGRQVGRLLPDGSFLPVPVGEEAVFEGTLFMPPLGSDNRRIPGELGRFKLDLGDAYYLHGTPYPESIGSATTHGCIRLLDHDLEYLFDTVRVGTPVFLY